MWPPIAARGRWCVAHEVVAFVNGEDEERVLLVDSVVCEPVEELLEGLIVRP